MVEIATTKSTTATTNMVAGSRYQMARGRTRRSWFGIAMLPVCHRIRLEHGGKERRADDVCRSVIRSRPRAPLSKGGVWQFGLPWRRPCTPKGADVAIGFGVLLIVVG